MFKALIPELHPLDPRVVEAERAEQGLQQVHAVQPDEPILPMAGAGNEVVEVPIESYAAGTSGGCAPGSCSADAVCEVVLPVIYFHSIQNMPY